TIHQGEVVKRLAGWAALLAAPTLIASWYGMNFRHMPELDERYAYPVLIAVTALVCVVLYAWLKRARWL
ncbi:CorA family divalent cation transporter, partial [Acinetobacter baumannii]